MTTQKINFNNPMSSAIEDVCNGDKNSEWKKTYTIKDMLYMNHVLSMYEDIITKGGRNV
jgi:hypothetical protein